MSSEDNFNDYFEYIIEEDCVSSTMEEEEDKSEGSGGRERDSRPILHVSFEHINFNIS